ncbi:MAG: helix-turn-helix domain-containing protein [Dehalococcoidales bacterium]|nr:helix-turn-helix domain-containing protein [Dehalococcoidales bacterium]
MRHFKPEAKAKSCSTPPAEFGDIRRWVAAVLLQNAGTDESGGPGLSQREIVAMLGVPRDAVSSSLKSLQAEDAIRIDRHRRTVVNKKVLERFATEIMKPRAYVLLRTRDGDSEQVVAIAQRQPGVVMVDRVEGLADVIFAVQASDRESLAQLTVRAIGAVEAMTEDVQLLPSRE